MKAAAILLQQVELAAHPHRASAHQYSHYHRLLHEAEWQRGIKGISDTFFSALDLQAGIRAAEDGWTVKSRSLWSRIARDGETPTYAPPSPTEIALGLTTGVSLEPLTVGAMHTYLGLAMDSSKRAGESALQHLGLGRTFAWAHPQNMAQDLFGARGSKIVQQMYGNHVDLLSKLIADATDPRNPKTMWQVQSEIKALWPDLQKYQVERIARTEVAVAWSTVQANAYAANGITRFESLIAQGPSIGENPETGEIVSDEPCDECVDAAASEHALTDDLPPWHPNCRCELVPVLSDENGDPWLPSQEPWAGGDFPADYEPTEAPVPAE